MDTQSLKLSPLPVALTAFHVFTRFLTSGEKRISKYEHFKPVRDVVAHALLISALAAHKCFVMPIFSLWRSNFKVSW